MHQKISVCQIIVQQTEACKNYFLSFVIGCLLGFLSFFLLENNTTTFQHCLLFKSFWKCHAYWWEPPRAWFWLLCACIQSIPQPWAPGLLSVDSYKKQRKVPLLLHIKGGTVFSINSATANEDWDGLFFPLTVDDYRYNLLGLKSSTRQKLNNSIWNTEFSLLCKHNCFIQTNMLIS